MSASVPSSSRPRATASAGPTAGLALSRRVGVRLVPALTEERSWDVLRQLRICWPSGSGSSSLTDAVSALKAALGQCPCAAACEQGPGTADGVIFKVHLKSFVEQQGLVGYDPNLDVLLGEPHMYNSSAVAVGAEWVQIGLFPFSCFLTKIRGSWTPIAFPSYSPSIWFESGADLMVWDGGGWRTPCPIVSLLLSVTEGTLWSLAELQEAVLQCPVSDPPALPASRFPNVLPFCQAIGLSSLLCSAAGQRPEQLLQHHTCGEL